MALGNRLEVAALTGALLLSAAFVASFIFGIAAGRGTPPAPVPQAAPFRLPDAVPGTVEVLNASGRGGMARAATTRLRSAGYDVVFFGNASERQVGAHGDSSVVLDRAGTSAVAHAIARELEIAWVQAAPDSTRFVDATVIIGKDWLAAQPDPAAPPGWRDRVRRWFAPSR